MPNVHVLVCFSMCVCPCLCVCVSRIDRLMLRRNFLEFGLGLLNEAGIKSVCVVGCLGAVVRQMMIRFWKDGVEKARTHSLFQLYPWSPLRVKNPH